jgi:hypothetical protein
MQNKDHAPSLLHTMKEHYLKLIEITELDIQL